MYETQFDDLYLGGSQTNKNRLSGEHAVREARMLQHIAEQRREQKDLYRRSLLHPEEYSGAKIPSEIPQETATAQVMWNGQITPNSAGRFLLIIDPAIQTANLYNSESLNGTGTGGSATTITLDHDSSIIDMFRLVSSSLIITYSGSLDKMSGYLVGATTSNISNAINDTFFTFGNIENLQNKRVCSPIDGIKMIYSPYDNQQLEYQAIGAYSGATSSHRWKKLFLIYGEGLPPTTCLRWDITRNIEYVSKPTLREYIPHTSAPACNYDAGIIEDVKKKEVQSVKQSQAEKVWTMKQTKREAEQFLNRISPINNLFANEDKIVSYGQNMLTNAFGSLIPSFK